MHANRLDNADEKLLDTKRDQLERRIPADASLTALQKRQWIRKVQEFRRLRTEAHQPTSDAFNSPVTTSRNNDFSPYVKHPTLIRDIIQELQQRQQRMHTLLQDIKQRYSNVFNPPPPPPSNNSNISGRGNSNLISNNNNNNFGFGGGGLLLKNSSSIL